MTQTPVAGRDFVAALHPVTRSRRHAFALIRECARQIGDSVDLPTHALFVAALADDGIVVETLALTDPDDVVAGFAELIRINHGAADLPVWGYFVAQVVFDNSDDLLLVAHAPRPDEIDWIDDHVADYGVELVDWLLHSGERGVSLLDAYGHSDRWLEPTD